MDRQEGKRKRQAIKKRIRRPKNKKGRRVNKKTS
jgi:hypothetical protein